MAVTEGILKVVLKHAEMSNARRVVSICLRIGELQNVVDEWLNRYFDYLSRGTIAEGAKFKIIHSPVISKCRNCEEVFKINIRELDNLNCPRCGGDKSILMSGREFFVEEIEVI